MPVIRLRRSVIATVWVALLSCSLRATPCGGRSCVLCEGLSRAALRPERSGLDRHPACTAPVAGGLQCLIARASNHAIGALGDYAPVAGGLRLSGGGSAGGGSSWSFPTSKWQVREFSDYKTSMITDEDALRGLLFY